MWKNVQYATHRMTLRPRRAAGGRRSAADSTTSPEPGAASEIGPGRTRRYTNKRRAIPTCACRPASARGTRRRSPGSAASFPTCSTWRSAAGTTSTRPRTAGRYLERRLPQRDGLLPRRSAALRADSRRRATDGARRYGASWTSSRRPPSRHVHAVHLLERDRASGARGSRAQCRRPGAEDATSPSEAQDQAARGSLPGRRPERRRARSAIKAIRSYFECVNDTSAGSRRHAREAEPKHLEALLQFAERAYRRPLAPTETRGAASASIASLRDEDGLDHEDAMRDIARERADVAATFCYRLDLRRRAGDGSSAALGLRAGQPVELFPVVQHAG